MASSSGTDIPKSTKFYMKYYSGEYQIVNSEGHVVSYGPTASITIDRFDQYLTNIDLDGEYVLYKGAGAVYGHRRKV